MMENNYFFKKPISKHTKQNERCACNYAIARNEEFQFIKQKLCSERQNQNVK